MYQQFTIKCNAAHMAVTASRFHTGWPKKSKPPPIFQETVLKIANEIDFFRKVEV